MPVLQKFSALRWPFACAMLLLAFLACTRWEVQELTPAQVVSEMKPARIRVTRADSTRVELVQPQVAGDSIIGSVPGRRVSLPLSDVAAVSLRKGNPVGTVLVVLGVLAAVGAAFLAAFAASLGD